MTTEQLALPRWVERLAPRLPTYRKRPDIFAQEVLGLRLTAYQKNILLSVEEHPAVAVRSGNGVGKSIAGAVLVLWWEYCFYPSIAITTAPTWHQVENILWREIRTRWANSRIPLGGESFLTRLELAENWYALGLSPDKPDRLQGFHSANLLLVVDEASGVDDEIFRYGDNILTSEHCRKVLLGNPLFLHGEFFRAFNDTSEQYKTILVSTPPTPSCSGLFEQGA